jgi:hypothetical protein
LFECREGAVDADDAPGEFVALLVAHLVFLYLREAFDALPAEVAFGLVDAFVFAVRDGVAALYLEDERAKVDDLALHLDFVGDVDANGRALPTDAFEQLLPLVLFHGCVVGAGRSLLLRPSSISVG